MIVALSKPLAVAVDIVAWGGIHASTGYLVHRVPSSHFADDGWLYRARRWEHGGRTYVRWLGIKRWKHLLPEAGDLFRGGFDKAKLADRSDDHLVVYVQETRRAELGHWLATAPAPLFFMWNPWYAAILLQLYAVAVNGPCIASQRYNRLRITRILGRRHDGR